MPKNRFWVRSVKPALSLYFTEEFCLGQEQDSRLKMCTFLKLASEGYEVNKQDKWGKEGEWRRERWADLIHRPISILTGLIWRSLR